MHFVLRCFGVKHDSNPGHGGHKPYRRSYGSSQKHAVTATLGAGPVAGRSNQAAPTLELAVKVLQPEVAEGDQNGHAGSCGVVQVMADDEDDRQTVDCSFPRRISLGSPLLLFNTPSVATHHSLTLKLQGAARPGSSAPVVDNWAALGSVADGRTTADSAERTTTCSNYSQARQHGSRNDASVASVACASPGARSAAVPNPQPDAHTQSQQPDAQPARYSQSTPNIQPTAPSSADIQPHTRLSVSRMLPVLEGSAGNLRTSPSRWSNSSNQATPLGQGGPRRQAGAIGVATSPASAYSTGQPMARQLPAEELAVLVATLARIRGHWLEALHTVVAMAAELLGADSLSVYLLSDSGATHAALACHGDAGGAIRLGMPQPAVALPGHKLTALQRLYQTGEPQRGSVWSGATVVLPGSHLSTSSLGPMPTNLAVPPGLGTLPHHNCRAQAQARGAVHQHLHDCNNQQQENLQSQQKHLHKQHIPCQQQPSASGLPPDWQAMRVLGGMTDFVAVPLLRGDLVVGALQVVDNCTPPEDITGAVPTSRRCRGIAELSVVATFIGTLLVDHEVLCLMGTLEAIASAQDVDGLVRAIARHVGLFSRMRKHITPGVRVALIRGDATALALFLDEGATAAAAAAAAGNLAPGVGGGSTTPVGVLSTAISRHSTACNLLQATWTAGCGGGGQSSGACTPDPRHIPSPGASTSGMAAGLGGPRGSQLAVGGGGGGGGASRSVVPLYSPSTLTRDPSSILDTEQSLLAATSVGGLPGATGRRTQAPSSAAPLTQPAAVVAGSEDAAGILHVHDNTSTSGFEGGGAGGEGLSGMAMSTGGDLWPWFASTASRGKGVTWGRGDESRAPTVNTAAVADAGTVSTPEAVMPRCAALVGLPSVVSEEEMLVTCGREHISMVDDLSAPGSGDLAAADAGASGRRVIAVCGPPMEMAASADTDANTDADETQLKGGATEPSLGHGPSAAVIMTGADAVSGDLLTQCVASGRKVMAEPAVAEAAAVAVAAASASASASGLMSLPSALLPVPNTAGPAIAHTRMGAISGGLYGRALAMAGEDSNTPGRGLGQVQGHAMLTRGTVLAEALAAGTGMYISDVAIYMQDGRNKSRDVFLAPSGRGGPAQPTNSIAVTTICHAGLPLVGIYLTYGTPLPASLLNALISKVHAFGVMLGPLLHERLTSGDSELADEWRYLLGEVLEPQAIQTAADEQRSRRSSAAPYNQPQQQVVQPQQQQQFLAPTPPPLTAPPSPLQILTGVAATDSRRHEPGAGVDVGGLSAVGVNTAVVNTAFVAPGSIRRRSGTEGTAYRNRASASRGPVLCGTWAAAGQVVGPQGTATDVKMPPLRRSQTADSGSLIVSHASGRAYPSADGSNAASCSFAKSRVLGSLRVSVTAEAAARAVTASASEPAPSDAATAARNTCSVVLASEGRETATISAPSVLRYGRASSNRMPLAPPPSPPSPMATALASAATQWPQAPGNSWRGALANSALHGLVLARKAAPVPMIPGPAWPAAYHLNQQQQNQQNHQQQRQRVPIPSPVCSPSHQPQQQQQQFPLTAQRLLNCSWRGATVNGHMPCSPSALAIPSAAAIPMTALPGGNQSLKPEKAASEDVTSGAASHGMYLRNGSGAGRNLDSSTQIYSESRIAQCASSISSSVAILSRSTSGTLGPSITAPTASPLLQADLGPADGQQTATDPESPTAAAVEDVAGVPSLSGASLQGAVDLEGAGDNASCGAAGEGGAAAADQSPGLVHEKCGNDTKKAMVTSRSKNIQLPRDSSLKVAQLSPTVPEAVSTGSDQDRVLLQIHADLRSPSFPQPASPSGQQQQQQQHVLPPLNPFASGCPVSPPSTLQRQPGSTKMLALENRGCDDGRGNISPPLLRLPAAMPPGALPLAAAAHCSPFTVSGPAVAVGPAAVSSAGVMSMSQLELSGISRLFPAYSAAASSVGGPGVGIATNCTAALVPNPIGSSASANVSACSHKVDVELSMQAWHLSADPSTRPSTATLGPRNSPGVGSFGPASLNVSQHGTCHDGISAGPLRLLQPRPHAPTLSPLSPGRQFLGVSAGAIGPPFGRRCSAGGMAPASPQPPPPPPRVGAGLSRLTTVATAAGVGSSSAAGAAAGGGASPPPFSDATARIPNAGSFLGVAGGGSGTSVVGVGGGPPGAMSSAKMPSPMVQRLRSSVRRNTSFNIMADPGVQDTGKVAPLMANLQDKLRSLQAEQVLARLHNKDASGADELSGLTILEPLGSGGFGTVFRGIFNGIEVAVKVLCERGAAGRSEAATMREAFELAVMTTISHPHIVQVLSAFTDVILTSKPNPAGGPNSTTIAVVPRSPATEELGEPTVVIAMEYCDGGSLADAVSAGRFRQRIQGGYGALQPCMPAIYATLLEIALALRHMHAMLLVHCDLKPANILLKSNMRDPRGFSAKLSDFGLVKMVVEDGTGGGGGVIGRDARTGTVTHMAPELIRATEASKMDASVDIYAFGVLMWEMLSTGPVYLGIRSEEIRKGVVDGALRPEFPPWSDEKYRALAEACLSTDPKARPTSVELVARLRTLLAESGALQDTIMRRPCKNSAFPGGNNLGWGPAAAAAGCGAGAPAGGFPGHYTAAAAGAMLGIGPADFCRPSRMLAAQQPPQHNYPLAAGGSHSRRAKSRSFSGNDSSTFPLHIL